MKKLVCALCVVLMAGAAFAADTIKVGEIATVTGDFAAYGVAEVESVKIGTDEGSVIEPIANPFRHRVDANIRIRISSRSIRQISCSFAVAHSMD